jgi:hypothetical protein
MTSRTVTNAFGATGQRSVDILQFTKLKIRKLKKCQFKKLDTVY